MKLQITQIVAPGLEYFPVAQSVHSFEIGLVDFFPAAQSVHAPASEDAFWPASQKAQPFGSVATSPLPHDLHPPETGSVDVFPKPQLEQLAAEGGENSSTEQLLQVDAPSPAYVPASQLEHSLGLASLVASSWYVPE